MINNNISRPSGGVGSAVVSSPAAEVSPPAVVSLPEFASEPQATADRSIDIKETARIMYGFYKLRR